MRTTLVFVVLIILDRATRSLSFNAPLVKLGAPTRSRNAGLELPRKKTQTSLRMAILGPVRYSTNDWFECLRSFPSSRILKRTRSNILFVSVWAFACTFLLQSKHVTFALPSIVHSILGSALGLLLVFRTNTSYDRFWEARKAQSALIVACRNIAQFTYVHIPRQHHSCIAALLSAYALVHKQHLQGVINHEELVPLVPFLNTSVDLEIREIIGKLALKRNRPLYVLRVLDKVINDAMAEKYCDASLHPSTSPKYIDKHFTEALISLSTHLAACERILKQPVPLSYSRHTSRFLSLYLLTLPFSLAPLIGWATVPAVTAICWSFVSIQEIGHFIEEPFDRATQVIPMNQIASVVRADVSEILDGVLSSDEITAMDSKLLRETRDNSRNDDELYFMFYKGGGKDLS